MTCIYVIGSLRNPQVPVVGNALRAAGYDAFDDWYSPGESCDDRWKDYEVIRGRSYYDAILGHHAEHAFALDYKHLDRCDAAVLVLPAGKSAHLELGWVIGQRKPGFVLFDSEPEADRFELMYRFVFTTGGDIVFNHESLLASLRKHYGV